MFIKYFKTLASKVSEYDKLYKKGSTNPFIDGSFSNKIFEKNKEQIYIWVDKEKC